MKAFGLTIETLFHEKIMLYRDLLDVLEQEKKSITEIDIEGLWGISEKKQQIASRIENIRKMIIHTLKDASPSLDMDEDQFDISRILSVVPSEIAERLKKVQVTLVSLKNNIQVLLSENKRFVGEYLNVLDELIGVITDSGSPGEIYGKDRCSGKLNSHLLLHREV